MKQKVIAARLTSLPVYSTICHLTGVAPERSSGLKRQENGENLPSRGSRSERGEDSHRPLQHRGADAENDRTAAEAENS